MSDDPEKKSTIAQVGGWIWGTIEGGFNEQQSISQIIVDAVIGMIPVVGDVTAARDLIAVILRLVEEPEKRRDKLEWLTLVLLVFALVPVAGGVIKGIGKLVIRAGEDVGRHGELVRDIIQFLNRVGEGDAIQFFKKLDFEKYAAEITGQWRKLTQRIDDVIAGVLRRAHYFIPDAMINRLRQMQDGIRDLKNVGEQMIPDSLKELNRRLKALQHALYEGEWHEIADGLKSTTREAEARLIEKESDSKKVKAWEATNLPHPPSTLDDLREIEGWPDLTSGKWLDPKGSPWAIATFSGPVRAVKIPAGTKIRRVVTSKSGKSGLFWSYELAHDGPSWRKDFAVLDAWSSNGYYIEFIVPEPGLWAWEGKVASQIENNASAATFGQLLPGGATQLLIDFEFEANAAARAAVERLRRIPTNWTAHMGLNVPEKAVTVQKLAPAELEPKRAGRASATAARGVHAADQQSQPAEGP